MIKINKYLRYIKNPRHSVKRIIGGKINPYENRWPSVIFLSVNTICNLKCKMCDIGQNRDSNFSKLLKPKDNSLIGFECYKKFIDDVKFFKPLIAVFNFRHMRRMPSSIRQRQPAMSCLVSKSTERIGIPVIRQNQNKNSKDATN